MEARAGIGSERSELCWPIIPAFYCVGMDYFKLVVVEYASTALLIVLVILVFSLHSSFGENRIDILEKGAVEFNQLPKQLSLNLMP